MTPIFLSLSITQLNTLVDSVLAWGLAYLHSLSVISWLPQFDEGSASALYIGQRLYQFPLGIFGVALGTVLYPRLTVARHSDQGVFAKELLRGLRIILLLGLPASAGLCLMAEPTTMTLFFHGAFDQHDVTQTTSMIMAYGLGVWAYMLLLILNRAFYALDDRWTPLRAGLICVAVNIGLSFALIPFFKSPGLAAATALSAIVQSGSMAVQLKHRIPELDFQSLFRVAWMGLVGCFAMTGVSLLIFSPLFTWADSTTSRAGLLLVQMVTCVVVYGISLRLMNCEELKLGRH